MRIVRPSTWATALLLASPIVAAQDTVLYDNFKGRTVDPQKWEGGITQSGATEILRRVQRERLRLDLRTSGNMSATTKLTKVQNSLHLPEDTAAKVSSIAVEASVRQSSVEGCSTEVTGSSDVEFQLGGFWFSNGNSLVPGDRTGDVSARISIRDEGQAPQWNARRTRARKIYDISAQVSVCENADCSESRNMFSENFDTVKKRLKKLSITWDHVSSQFIFTSDRNVVTYNYSEHLYYGGAPNVAYQKGVQVAGNLENCGFAEKREPTEFFDYGSEFAGSEARGEADYSSEVASSESEGRSEYGSEGGNSESRGPSESEGESANSESRGTPPYSSASMVNESSLVPDYIAAMVNNELELQAQENDAVADREAKRATGYIRVIVDNVRLNADYTRNW